MLTQHLAIWNECCKLQNTLLGWRFFYSHSHICNTKNTYASVWYQKSGKEHRGAMSQSILFCGERRSHLTTSDSTWCNGETPLFTMYDSVWKKRAAPVTAYVQHHGLCSFPDFWYLKRFTKLGPRYEILVLDPLNNWDWTHNSYDYDIRLCCYDDQYS
jgi:hypothetical protein